MVNLNEIHLLCLHGGPGLDSWIYREFLKEEFNGRIHFIDQKRPGQISDWINQVLDYVNQLKTNVSNKVFLLGHSSGGCLASKFLKRYPELIDGAIFISSPYDASADVDYLEWMKNPNQKLTFALENREDPVLPKVNEEVEKVTLNLEPLAAEFYQKWNIFFPRDFKNRLEEFIEKTDFCIKSAMDFYTNEFPNYDLSEDLKGCKMPLLYLYPYNDQRITPNHMEKIKSIPNLEFKVCPGSHFCFVDHPKEFAQEVNHFINHSI